MLDDRSRRSEQLSLSEGKKRSERGRQRTPPPNLAPLKTTAVYDTYWRFAAERQQIFFARVKGQAPPWTEDTILAAYKFTNAYRAADRVSQFLIRHVIYRDDLPSTSDEVFFRTILFKLFNKIETWTLLEDECGPLTWAAYDFRRYNQVLSKAMFLGKRIYSAAYIMPSALTFGYSSKHSNHLALLAKMMTDGLPSKIAAVGRMQDGFDLLIKYPSFGDFLAYQFITDINYSELTQFTENDFVVPGPGALDGISKCFEDTAGLTPTEIVHFVAERQDDEFRRLGITFRSLWGRRLQLIDCQNLFCEVSKYARQKHPDVQGMSNRKRIKQKFRPTFATISYWFPPKWGINDEITAQTKANRSL